MVKKSVATQFETYNDLNFKFYPIIRAFMTREIENLKNFWYFDFNASRHICNNKCIFLDL